MHQKIKLYLYPTLNEQGEIIQLNTFETEPHLAGLLTYLKDNEKLEDIQKYDEKLMTIRTDNVLGMIQNGVGDWEKMVPASVVKQIKENHSSSLLLWDLFF